MRYYEPLVYIVKEEEDGAELKKLLYNKLKLSRKLLSRLKLTEQGIMVNGERKYISVRVKAGDTIEVRMQQEVSEDILPEPMPLDILYEDADLLILNKAAGIVVHPTHGHYIHTLANGVVHYWQERGEQYRFRPVHRLDQDTSGVIAVAKNPYAHQHISEQMKANQVLKRYTAIVRNHPPVMEGTVNAPIDRDPSAPHVRIVTETGYPAVTHYRVERRFRSASLISLTLETGRTHQIRVHMKHIGCPLIGDKLYTVEDQDRLTAAAEIERHALHASTLGFIHPVHNVPLQFTAPLPADMQRLIAALDEA